MTKAETVLKGKQIKTKKSYKRYCVYYDGELIAGFKGKLIWNSYTLARKAVINMLNQYQFVKADDNTWDHIKAFDTLEQSELFVDELISLGKIEIKEVTL